MRCSIVLLAVMILLYAFGSDSLRRSYAGRKYYMAPRDYQVSPLRCHVCVSYSSWDDCTKSQNPLTCEPEDTHCLRQMVHVDMQFFNITTYAKTCATSDKCTPQAVNQCKHSSGFGQMGIKDVKCDLECCKGDLCY